jgi:hypothetical protein
MFFNKRSHFHEIICLKEKTLGLDGSFYTPYNTCKLKLCLNYIVDWINNAYERK